MGGGEPVGLGSAKQQELPANGVETGTDDASGVIAELRARLKAWDAEHLDNEGRGTAPTVLEGDDDVDGDAEIPIKDIEQTVHDLGVALFRTGHGDKAVDFLEGFLKRVFQASKKKSLRIIAAAANTGVEGDPKTGTSLRRRGPKKLKEAANDGERGEAQSVQTDAAAASAVEATEAAEKALQPSKGFLEDGHAERFLGAPKSFLLESLLGTLYFSQGDAATAARYLDRAVALKPDDLTTLQNLGLCLHELGLMEDAQKVFRAALTHTAERTEDRYTTTIYLVNAMYDELIELKQEHDLKKDKVLITAISEGEMEDKEATRLWDIACKAKTAEMLKMLAFVEDVELPPKLRIEGMLLLGQVHELHGDLKAAEESWAEVKDDSVDALLHICRIKLDQNLVHDAELVLDQATALDPSSAGVQLNKIKFAVLQNKLEVACELFSEYLANFPDEVLHHSELAVLISKNEAFINASGCAKKLHKRIEGIYRKFLLEHPDSVAHNVFQHSMKMSADADVNFSSILRSFVALAFVVIFVMGATTWFVVPFLTHFNSASKS